MIGEKRLHERRLMSCTGVLAIEGKSLQQVHLQDLSLGGISVICDNNLATGLSCVMSFDLLFPQGKLPLKKACRVIYSVYSHRDGGFKVGLQFLGLGEQEAELIKRYMRHTM